MRVEMDGLPTDNWHHFLRLRDFHQILSEVPLDGVSRVLELGAGDGAQTFALRERFREVVSIDISPSAKLNGIIVADAASLPFVDGYFDLIFSSNVLEHVESIEKSLLEMKRVLKPDGIMIHTMPTVIWKVIQVLGRPLATVIKIARKILPGLSDVGGRAEVVTHGFTPNSDLRKRPIFKKLLGQLIPTVHGVSNNHIQEFIRFRTQWWVKKFNQVELNCYRSSPLFLHSPYDILPYKFLHLRERIAMSGIASVQVFWLRS
ncbi:MAG: class I SAM-dependent methyltransferase [Chloroflexota bacterium]|nr:class I SAM-dependent methyltransferase [Chloroflexota bacterium]